MHDDDDALDAPGLFIYGQEGRNGNEGDRRNNLHFFPFKTLLFDTVFDDDIT